MTGRSSEDYAMSVAGPLNMIAPVDASRVLALKLPTLAGGEVSRAILRGVLRDEDQDPVMHFINELQRRGVETYLTGGVVSSALSNNPHTYQRVELLGTSGRFCDIADALGSVPSPFDGAGYAYRSSPYLDTVAFERPEVRNLSLHVTDDQATRLSSIGLSLMTAEFLKQYSAKERFPKYI